MSITTKSHTELIKQASRDREAIYHAQINLASVDERIRFNEAIEAGAIVYLDTFSGKHKVKYVDNDWWYHTDGNGGFEQSWAGCNDGTWDNLLKQANVKRNHMFSHNRY